MRKFWNEVIQKSAWIMSLGRFCGYLLLLMGGAYGIRMFHSLWDNMEEQGGPGFASLLPENIDPLISAVVALGVITMCLGMIWLLWLIMHLPIDTSYALGKRFPKWKVVLLPVGWIGIAGALYWLYNIGIISPEAGRNILYAVLAFIAFGILLQFTPLGPALKVKVDNWGWVQKEKQRVRAKSVKRLEKELAQIQSELKETEEELKVAREKSSVKV